MLEWMIYRRGLWRIYWGSCPECNSDAPALDKCKFCGGFRGWRDKTARRELKWQWVKECGYDWMAYWT